MPPPEQNENRGHRSEGSASPSDPLRDHKESVRQLFRDYERRANEMRRRGWRHLAIVFVLLAATVAAAVFAPVLARLDLQVLLDIQTLIEDKRDQLVEIEREIAALTFSDFRAAVVGKGGRSVIVGEDGAAVTSDKKRLAWRHRRTGVGNDLRAASFNAIGETVVAVGGGGRVVVSDNDGRKWRIAETSTRERLNDVAFGAAKFASTVIAVGNDGTIELSNDNAMTWEPKASRLVEADLNAVAFVGDSGVVVAVGDDGVVVVSLDGGKTWKQVSTPTRSDLYAVASADGSVVAVGDDGAIVVSTNPAIRWTQRGIENGKHRFNAVALTPDGNIGFAVGKDGLIVVSRKGLVEWEERTSNTSDELNDIVLDERGATAIAAGEDGAIVVSDDRGTQWHFIESRSPNEILTAMFDGKVALFAGRNSTILRSELAQSRHVRDMTIKMISNGFEVSRQREQFIAQRDRIKAALRELEAFRNLSVSDNRRSDSGGFSPFFYQTNALRLAILAIAFFVSQHLMGLARHNFHLAEYYYARRNVVLLTMNDALPWSSLTADEFEQVVDSLSPDGVEQGRAPQSVIDLAMRLAKSIVRTSRRKPPDS